MSVVSCLKKKSPRPSDLNAAKRINGPNFDGRPSFHMAPQDLLFFLPLTTVS